MGLDVYFYKGKRKNYNAYTKAFKEWQEKEPESGKMAHDEYEKLSKAKQEEIQKENSEWYESQPKMDKYDITDIGYFRKVNFLMAFFKYEDNCEFKEIAKCELEDLVERCNAVLTTPKKSRQEKAEDLLPTQSGFFYGSTDYNEWYYKDVEDVRDWASEVLENLKDDEIILMYCWW